MKKLSIAIIHLLNKNKPFSMNKDINGGIGTADDYTGSWGAKILGQMRKKMMHYPVLSLAYLQGILKNQGHQVTYYEVHDYTTLKSGYDMLLIYGSIVDYKHENETAASYKRSSPNTKVGFVGPFPTICPELFTSADFVIKGEPESFFMNEFNGTAKLKGEINVRSITDMNALSPPNLDGYDVNKYSYGPSFRKKPFFFLLSSKGCPYSCSYYCTYGQFQGPKIRQRSPEKVVADMIYLKDNYKIQSIQFRDPTFGMKKGIIYEICDEMERKKLAMDWGIETRLDLLSEDKIRRMHKFGLRNLNVGIETPEAEVAKLSKRKLVESEHQESMVKLCKSLGINVTAFFILAFENDTVESMKKTVDYAIKINPSIARFAVSTPFPGTKFYDDLKQSGELLINDLEKFSQFRLVYKHKNLSPNDVDKMVGQAINRFYFRPSFVLKGFFDLMLSRV